MRALLLGLLLLLGACTQSVGAPLVACVGDDECAAGQLCFAEGCGEPGTGIVVEVTGGTLSTYLASDFAIENGTLTREHDFELSEPLKLSGQVLRELTPEPNPLRRVQYTEPVSVRAEGESVLLPGIKRAVQARLEDVDNGFYSMRLPSGTFRLTALPAAATVPPISSASLLEPGAEWDIIFPSEEGAKVLQGQLVKTTDTALVPPEPVLLSTDYANGAVPAVEVQLLAADSTPLSQRVEVRSTGEFSLTLSPEARRLEQLILVAAPRDPGASIPTKRFPLSMPLPPAISLEYGDFGRPGEGTGTGVASTGAAVAGAQVLLSGAVRGGGDTTFRSKVALTGDDGAFTLSALPSNEQFTLHVVPPRMSRASVTWAGVTLSERDGALVLSPSTIALSDRLQVRGAVHMPGGGPASGVTVRATPEQSPGALSSLPVEPVDTVTDGSGAYQLPLDAGRWRFEFIAGAQLPLSSRLFTINAPTEGAAQVEVPEVTLSHGLTVTGRVRATVASKLSEAAYSQLRFFSVRTLEGKQSSILLGTAIADERGAYKMVLPAAPPTP